MDCFSAVNKKRGKPATPRPQIPATAFARLSALEHGIDILATTDGKGMGAFSTVAIVKGDVLGEYTGERMTRKEIEARYWELRKINKHDRKWLNSRKRRDQGITGDYLFDMGNDSFVDGEDADCSSWCRFANHADPGTIYCNVEVCARLPGAVAGTAADTPIASSTDIYHLYLIALVDITVGSELCYDYGENYWDGGGFD